MSPPILNIGQILANHGYTEDVMSQQLADWHSRVWDSVGTSNPATKFRGTAPIDLLPYESQVKFMGEYREITGLNTVLNQLSASGGGTGVENIRRHMTGPALNADRNPFGRLNVDTSQDSLISRIYSGMNLQIKPPTPRKAGVYKAAYGVEHNFTLGSIPRLENVERGARAPGSLKGKNLMVFDIETAGFRPGGIREISYQTMQMGGKADPVSGRVIMRPTQGARGRMVHEGSAVPVDEFLERKFDLPHAPLSNSGDDFLGKVLPWLRQANNADHIVGHNIESFDMSQIFQGIAGTKRYSTDASFRSYIDSSFESLNAKTIDTLTMARNAPNLANLTSGTQSGNAVYSIENLLLKTDLAERIGYGKLKAAMGYDAKSGIFTKGLHHGDVDTLITSGLLEHMGSLKQVNLGKNARGKQRIFTKQLEKQIHSSAAITPFTQIRDPANIHRRVKQILGSDHPNVTPIGQDILLSRKIGYGGNAASVIPSRQLLPGLGKFDRMIGRAGRQYEDLYDDHARPSTRQFNRYRRSLKERGMGFAGLSYEERLFGTAMSDITSGVADTGFSKLARESMVSRFSMFDLDSIQYVTESGKVTLPPQMLNHFGLLGGIDDPAMFSLSIVRPSATQASSSVNLAYKFDGMMDVEVAVHHLDTLASGDLKYFAEVMEMDPEDAATRTAFRRFKDEAKNGKLADALRETGTTHGVSVAQITEEQGATRAIKLMEAANNTNQLTDDVMIPFRTPLMDIDTASGVVRTAGVYAEIGEIGLETRAEIGAQVRKTAEVYRPVQSGTASGFSGLNKGARMGATARSIDNAVAEDVVDSALKKYLYVSDNIIPHAPKAMAIAAVLGIGAYAMGKKRKQDKYDVAFEYGGQETGSSNYELGNILQQRQEQGINGYYRQIDPLATASLTDNLYNGSIGHTSTQWDKSSSIYGGVL